MPRWRRSCGATPILLEDGDVLSLAPGRPEVVDSAPVGRLVLDGNRRGAAEGGVLAARRRMLFNGVVLGSFAVDEAGRLLRHAAGQRARPVRAGRPGDRRASPPSSAQAVADLPAPLRRDDAALADAARAALRRALGRRLQKRPMVDVHLLRV